MTLISTVQAVTKRQQVNLLSVLGTHVVSTHPVYVAHHSQADSMHVNTQHGLVLTVSVFPLLQVIIHAGSGNNPELASVLALLYTP